MIPTEIVTRMRCPQCWEPLSEDGAALRCGQGHSLDVDGSYVDGSTAVRDAATRATFDSFGYEWTTFDRVQPEDEDFWRTYLADVDLDALAGRVGLDAGCGKGRFSLFTAAHLRALVALDGSDAVHAAARNLASVDNAAVVRADLRDAPFLPAAFDFISCLGVLHHLDDPRAGFDALVRLLAPGGLLLLYVYSRPERGTSVRAVALRAATALRRATTRIDHPLLRLLCAPLAALLYGLVVVPGALGERVGWHRLAALPLQTYRGRPWRSLWLDTFDRLSAPIERRYLWSELAPWFTESGLEVQHARDEAGWFVLARR